MPLSSTSASTPLRASHQPVLSPVTPPPMMTTEAPVMPLPLISRSPATTRWCPALRARPRPSPNRRSIASGCEPNVPGVPGRLGLVHRPEHSERQRPNRRAVAGQRDLLGRHPGAHRQQHLDLLAAATTLAGAHPRARKSLHLVGVTGPSLASAATSRVFSCEPPQLR